MTHTSPHVYALLASAFFVALGQDGPLRAAQVGVVVEEVTKGSAGEKADIRAGDVLLAWERFASPPANPEGAQGAIKSVFDWMWVEMEQGPRGTVRVRGEREGKETAFEVPMGNWGIKVRPALPTATLKIYVDGRAAVASQELEKGVALWRTLAASADVAEDAAVKCWINLIIGDTWADARRWEDAQRGYEEARATAIAAANVLAEGFVWDAIGRAYQSENKLPDAEKAFQASGTLKARAGRESVAVARLLNDAGRAAWNRGDLASAEASYRRAIAIQEKLAPGSLDLSTTLNNLGLVAWNRGDLGNAQTYHQRAFDIREKLAPGSSEMARSLNNLGLIARDRGELATAEAYYQRSLAIFERLAPGGLDVAAPLTNLGLVLSSRGELASAEAHYKRALEIYERVLPDSLNVSHALNNLGIVAYNRDELPMAESYFRRALEIRETLSPDNLDVSHSLNNLAAVALKRGDAATADAYNKRALEIRDKLAPDSLYVADSLASLGDVAHNDRDWATAEDYYGRALAIREALAPGGLDVAGTLQNLGVVAHDRGDLRTSEAYLKRALAIREKLSAGSSAEAESNYDLGVVYRKTKQNRLAADHLRRGIEALEAQIGRLGGSQEAQSGFGAQFADLYRDYIDLLIEENQSVDAFHVLERSRARTLLGMMAERDLVFTADLPPDLERERKRIAWEYDQTQSRLAQLNPSKEQAEIDTLLGRIGQLRDQQSDIVAQIRQQSPRLASLQYPQPLDVTGVQAALDPGTVLLSYSVGKDKSHLFALTADAGVQAIPLGIGEVQLREEVEAFRNLIQRARPAATDLTRLLERGRHLYGLLVQPAAKTIERAQRVLVVPDGPLHVLPFAALVCGGDPKAAAAPRRRHWQYLIEWKPVHVVVSATVYAELRREVQTRSDRETARTLVAFGDPKYPASSASADEPDLATPDAVVRSMLARGYRLTPLPATKSEVAAIAELYRGKAATYVGEAATEERAKAVAKQTTYLHFASHGLLDERFPLNSGLALTIPSELKEGQDNGILQAWEIFERVRIDADLVVLSACETALGKEMGGEGLVGLTRAFEYAGARSVVASLWSVADETTSALMKRFYGHLKAGRSKDAALRRAQMDLLRSPVSIQHENGRGTAFDASHPYYWAAFQLNGDWR